MEQYLRAEIQSVRTEVGMVRIEVASMKTELAATKANIVLMDTQHRSDLDRITTGQREIQTALTTSIEDSRDELKQDIKESREEMSSRITPIETDVKNINLWRAKVVGYVIGVAAVMGLIFKAVEVAWNHIAMAVK